MLISLLFLRICARSHRWGLCCFSKDYRWMTAAYASMVHRAAIFCARSSRSWRSSLMSQGRIGRSIILLDLQLFKLFLYDLLWLWRSGNDRASGFPTVEVICTLGLNLTLVIIQLFLYIYWICNFLSGNRDRTRERSFNTLLSKKNLTSVNESRILA